MTELNKAATAHLVVFDGLCNICNGWVKFIIKRDALARISFASAQTNLGIALLERNSVSTCDPETMLFLRGEMTYTKSDAVIQILVAIGGGWSCARLLLVVPKPLRDRLYDLVAKNRYRLAGKRGECAVPTDQVRSRFLS